LILYSEKQQTELYTSGSLKRGGAVWESEGDDFDEDTEFEELLDVVDSYADAEAEAEFEGGPGQSSELRSFYCKTKAQLDEAVKNLYGHMNEKTPPYN
jgi:hypothetical protein